MGQNQTAKLNKGAYQCPVCVTKVELVEEGEISVFDDTDDKDNDDEDGRVIDTCLSAFSG